MIDGVLFDYGNTLLQYNDFSLPAYGRRLQEAMRDIAGQLRQAGVVGAEFDPAPLGRALLDRLLAIETRARRELFEFDLTAEIAQGLAERFPQLDGGWDARVDEALLGVMRQTLKPRADGVPALRALKQAGLKTGLVSNTQFRGANHLADLRRDGMLALLDATVFSIDLKIRKPRPEIFRAALEALGVEAARAMFVGDSIEHDIDGARAMGMKTVLVRTPDNAIHAQSRADHHADAVVDSLLEIPALIQGAGKTRL